MLLIQKKNGMRTHAPKFQLRDHLSAEHDARLVRTKPKKHTAVQAISRFANVTLSAFYFDITKDILYAERVDSVARRSVVTVLEQVSDIFHRFL